MSDFFTCIDASHPVNCTCDILDKNSAVRQYVAYMFNRTAEMFEYENLPETIPPYILELYLQMFGSVAFAEVDGSYYVFYGNAGGPPDPYYRPTHYVVANPGLGISKTFRIENHFPPFDHVAWDSYSPCVYIRNDMNAIGLAPLYSRYATELTENDISIRSAQINSRQQTMITAASDQEAASAKTYIENLEAGRMAVVGEKPFLDGIKAQNVSTMSSNSIIQLIELQQYLKASWFNDIGLNANFNMKREYLSTEEIQASTDVLLPLADDMLKCRESAVDYINKLFNLNITVKKNSAWENKEKEIEAARGELDEQNDDYGDSGKEEDGE